MYEKVYKTTIEILRIKVEFQEINRTQKRFQKVNRKTLIKQNGILGKTIKQYK